MKKGELCSSRHKPQVSFWLWEKKGNFVKEAQSLASLLFWQWNVSSPWNCSWKEQSEAEAQSLASVGSREGAESPHIFWHLIPKLASLDFQNYFLDFHSSPDWTVFSPRPLRIACLTVLINFLLSKSGTAILVMLATVKSSGMPKTISDSLKE